MIPPLSALQAFEAIARRKSFSLAASELHLTASAVSHQVAKLEGLLGLRLFERSSKGVELTPAGQHYLDKVGSALGAIQTATEHLRHGAQDSLHLHSAPSFASLWLMPRIGRFAALHPHIALNLSASPQHSDFQVGEVDLDIRYGLPQWPHLEVRPILSESVMPLASPEFIRQQGVHEVADLLRVPLIQSSVNLVQWSEWFDRFWPGQRPQRMAFRFDRAMMSLDAAQQSLGVALESTSLAQDLIHRGRLQPVLDPSYQQPVQAHFLVFPTRHAARAPVQAFLSWLQAETTPLAA